MAESHPQQAAFDRLSAEPRFQAQHLASGWAVNYAGKPKLNDDGSMTLSMRFPVFYAWEGLNDPEAVMTKIAGILEREWG